jgi:DNA-binding transcriptional regulator/RsmH inhibitor MraZ
MKSFQKEAKSMRELEKRIDERMDEIEEKLDILLETNESVGEVVDTADTLITEIKPMDTMGRITIPKSFRQILGVVGENVDVEVSLVGDTIVIKKV